MRQVSLGRQGVREESLQRIEPWSDGKVDAAVDSVVGNLSRAVAVTRQVVKKVPLGRQGVGRGAGRGALSERG